MALRNIILFIISSLSISFYATSQGMLKGSIKNEKGEALSFVSVSVKNSSKGTTGNESGYYLLKLDSGSYDIVFHYIGYNLQAFKINMGSGEVRVLDVQLVPSSYQLNEVRINATAEDPAYPIMRQVIARRGIYLREAKEYNCKVYMKGLQRLTTIPKRVLLVKVPEEIKPGIVYLSESLSELSFQQPEKYKERMISSKVSGSNKAFSYNQAAALQFTLYDNLVPSYGLNERGFVSPLANNAMMYYRYKLIGEQNENGMVIYKIQLIPIRKSDPVFKGHIYIVKDSWRLHSTDLMLDKSSNIEFVDTLYIKQNYARQAGGVWMPVSQRLIFQLGILGFRGNGYFVSVFSDYKVKSLYPAQFYQKETDAVALNVPTPQVRKVEKVKIETIIPKPKKKDKAANTDSSLFEQKYFSNEIMTVEKESNKTDDSTWNAIRPIPLTEEEVTDYHVKDSAREVHESRPYMDSMDRISNKPDWSSFTLTGYTYSRSYKKEYFSVEPILTNVQFNTVEGWVVNPSLSYTRTLEDRKYYYVTPNLRYGFSSHQFYGKISAGYKFNPLKEATVRLSGGFFVEQYNQSQPISPALNTVFSLFNEQNFMKIYQKGFIEPSVQWEAINGVFLNTSIEYSKRVSLSNRSDFTLRKDNKNQYTDNQPVNSELASTYFDPHHALIFELQASIAFAQKYAMRPYRKVVYGSKYPKLNLSYRKGLNVFNSAVNFDELNAWVRDAIDCHLFGEFNYYLKAGSFLQAKSVFFPDFHHFTGNQIIFYQEGNGGFQLLDYYYYSTAKSFVEVHFDHHFNGFFLNKIPLIRKLKWQEVASLNYLKTTSSPNYMEWGVGIEHILKVCRVDYFQSYLNMNYQMQGIRIGFGF